MKNNYNLRSIAAKAIGQVLDQGQSLSTVLPTLQTSISDKDRGLLQELCFGTLRVLPQLEWCMYITLSSFRVNPNFQDFFSFFPAAV